MKTSLIFLLGIGMGTVLGLLVAPEPGKVTRKKIREEADKMIDKMMAKANLKHHLEEAEPTVVVVEERYTI
jgi:gas vesicle protein